MENNAEASLPRSHPDHPDNQPKLIACPCCKKDVSDRAPTCPHCGHVLKKQEEIISQKKNEKDPLIAIILTVIFGPLGLLYVSVKASMIMLVCHIFSAILCAALIGYLLLPICYIASIIWAYNLAKDS